MYTTGKASENRGISFLRGDLLMIFVLDRLLDAVHKKPVGDQGGGVGVVENERKLGRAQA